MMKKVLSLLAAASCLVAGAFSAQAMDSATLLNMPGRYRVVSTQGDGVVYVDMDSVKAIQTMDYPNSIENISCVLYVEKYAADIDAAAFQDNRLVRQINEYKAVMNANKREGRFSLTANLVNVYTPDGRPYEIKIDTIQFKDAKTMFINTHRVAMIPKT